MIILQPKKEMSRDEIVKDELALSQRINCEAPIVIIPYEYDIVSMDDCCELLEDLLDLEMDDE